MRKARFSEEQMVAIIREGNPLSALAKRHGISCPSSADPFPATRLGQLPARYECLASASPEQAGETFCTPEVPAIGTAGAQRPNSHARTNRKPFSLAINPPPQRQRKWLDAGRAPEPDRRVLGIRHALAPIST